jgi:tRNA dimethylallyltransferase
MQVFRGMDIGTAKPDAVARERFAYHLVDVADPSEEYTAAEFQAAGTAILDAAAARDADVVIAGGSGLHFRSLVDPLEFPRTDSAMRAQLEGTDAAGLIEELLAADPDAAAVVDLANPRRVLRAVEILRLTGATPTVRAGSVQAERVRAYEPSRTFTAVGVDPGEGLGARIEARFDEMLDAGLLDEVAALAPRLGRTACRAVGYRQMLDVVERGRPLAAARDEAIRATASLAKRQRTYFRRDPRIRWIPWHHETEQMLEVALDSLIEDATWIS